MAQNLTVEERLARLESEVQELRLMILEQRFKGSWLEPFMGSMKDEPAFAEAIRLGREIREAERPADEDAKDVPA
ncbi:MAG TPA: hypothetical protein VGZ47_03150 [Gemmataceae bacterium]|jgi:hypothetical protein|nr:hypothetical protein [Gemmataceae bacterium]